MCTWSSCSPAREFSLFSETAHLGWVVEDESEKWRVEMVSVYNWLGPLYCWMKSLLSAGTFSPIAVLKIYLPTGQVVRAFSVVRPKICLSRAIGRVGISSPDTGVWICLGFVWRLALPALVNCSVRLVGRLVPPDRVQVFLLLFPPPTPVPLSFCCCCMSCTKLVVIM